MTKEAFDKKGTNKEVPDKIVTVDGTGSDTCNDCHGRLDYSWLVKLESGKTETLCSTCLSKRYTTT